MRRVFCYILPVARVSLGIGLLYSGILTLVCVRSPLQSVYLNAHLAQYGFSRLAVPLTGKRFLVVLSLLPPHCEPNFFSAVKTVLISIERIPQ